MGQEEKSGYSETDLEQAILDRLEHFLLELGKGFLFEARQKRFTFDEDHYFVDVCPVRAELRQGAGAATKAVWLEHRLPQVV